MEWSVEVWQVIWDVVCGQASVVLFLNGTRNVVGDVEDERI